MKIRIILLVSITLVSSMFLLAQEQKSKTIKKIHIHDASIQSGLSFERSIIGTIADFKSLAPQSVLLNNDLKDYSQEKLGGLSESPCLSAAVALQFGNKERTMYKKGPLLRLGFSYVSGVNLQTSFYKDDIKHFDTLTSSQTSNTFYLDSVKTKNYSMNYSSNNQLRLDASVIYRTNSDARWSLFGGMGISSGLSFNSSTSILYYEFKQVQSSFDEVSSKSYHFNNNDIKTEYYRNKNGFNFSAYIPIGVDFRMGNKSEFWKRTHLFNEFRPSINITSIPELRTMVNTRMQASVGIRVTVD